MSARIVRLFIMDENKPLPQDTPDLARQYQDILDKYARELVKNESPLPTPEPPTVAPSLRTTPVDSPQLSPPVPTPSDPLPSITLPPPAITSQSVTPPPTRNIFKYLFFISLLVFLGVAATLVYTLFQSPATPPSASTPSSQPTLEPSPTISSFACELNDQRYQVGDSFPAADNCNTCTCQSDLTISCTEKACDSTASPVPTQK